MNELARPAAGMARRRRARSAASPAQVVGDVYGLRVFRFFGETLRQAGILIVGSTAIIWTLMFILGLQCGIEGAYFTAAQGAPAYSGVFAAWCDLREITPYAFGYMMSAKVGTGIVAELGAMRISDEIDALEVMGINSMTFLCATRLLAAWLVLPFMYMAGIGAAFLASYIAVVQQIGYVSSGGYLLIFWQFQNPPDFLYSLIKAMFMATAIVLVACYYGYNASGGPVGVGTGDGKVNGAQPRARPRHRDARHTDLLGRQPACADRGLSDERPARWPRGRRRRRSSSTRTKTAPVRRRRDAIEFVDVHKSFGRNHVLRGLNMALPEGKISMIIGPSGHGQVRLHQAHRRPALPRPGRRDRARAVRSPASATPSCSSCARSSACCSRTARCSGR